VLPFLMLQRPQLPSNKVPTDRNRRSTNKDSNAAHNENEPESRSRVRRIQGPHQDSPGFKSWLTKRFFIIFISSPGVNDGITKNRPRPGFPHLLQIIISKLFNHERYTEWSKELVPDFRIVYLDIWLRGLRCVTAAARLLGLRVRNPPREWTLL
jgi:hypothetical protein